MRFGVTGHMNITTETADLVYAEIVALLTTANVGELVGISCLARGADAVFAQAVLEAGGRLQVVLPSRNYRQRKVKPAYAEQFDRLLDRAEVVLTMDFDDTGVDAYEAANDAVLDSCDRLVAVWDGENGDKGGTGSVVEMARERGIPVDVVWPEGAMRR